MVLSASSSSIVSSVYFCFTKSLSSSFLLLLLFSVVVVVAVLILAVAIAIALVSPWTVTSRLAHGARQNNSSGSSRSGYHF